MGIIMNCNKCNSIMRMVTNGYICDKCGNAINPIYSNEVKIIPNCVSLNIDNGKYIKYNKEKTYILVSSLKCGTFDEQITLLVDEDNKTYFKFYDDGYEGISAEYIKAILNFLNIKYFEDIYKKIPEKYYKEYKKCNWDNPNS